MMRQRWFTTAVCMCMFAVLLTGCRTKRSGGGSGTDEINPEDMTTDPNGLSQTWGEKGPRIQGVPLENVMFDFDSAQIKASEQSKIDQAAQYLKEHSNYRMVLEGHCDERGTLEYNMSLGERRAAAVRAYLIGLASDSSILMTESYGEEKPLNAGHDESAWQENRRVEFAVYNK